jgi:8-oxo-dGTP pyrophosphatase MutT (NUDIX family)
MTVFDNFIREVSSALAKPLPGAPAQVKMSSMRRIMELSQAFTPSRAVRSSVLILLYVRRDDFYTAFIKRSDYNGVHSGQIGLPGGKSEPSDRDLIQTALRESHEEIGLIPQQVRVIGKLTDLYIPPSNYLVTPVVGYLDTEPVFHRDPEEVEDIIEVRLLDFLSDHVVKKVKIPLKLGLSIKAPAFVINGHVIWGATAMMMSEFIEVIRPVLNAD